MKKINIYNLAGEVVGERELSPEVFEVAVKPAVIQQAVVAQRANARKPWAHTKVRSEVRGGGKKPWKQKGTGRARVGSIRSPLWRSGGVTFGPRSDRNYTQSLNKKMRKAALRMILSDKVASEKLIVVDSLALPEVKTKLVAQALQKLPIKGRKTILVLDKDAKNVLLSSRNMPHVMPIWAGSLNALDMLSGQTMVVPVGALSMIEELYGSTKTERMAK